MRRLAIDLNPSGRNPFLDLAARAEAGIRQRLLQLDGRLGGCRCAGRYRIN
jgi:hypothetical protein